MLLSIALILLLGLLFGSLFSKAKLPSLLGMILVGIVMSPYALDLIDESILNISADIRQMALVIIKSVACLSKFYKEVSLCNASQRWSIGTEHRQMSESHICQLRLLKMVAQCG